MDKKSNLENLKVVGTIFRSNLPTLVAFGVNQTGKYYTHWNTGLKWVTLLGKRPNHPEQSFYAWDWAIKFMITRTD